VESIAAGGAGVARLDGRAVFIPRTVPGDSVRFRISADKGKFLRGELEEVLEAGYSRRKPPCIHWAACGGCPLQQMAPQSQMEAKQRIVLDAIARIGKFELPVPLRISDTASGEFAYRQRARFQVKENSIGFFAPGTRRLVPLKECLLVEEAIAVAFQEIRGFLQKEPAARRVEAVELTSLGPRAEDGAGVFLYPLGSRDGRKGPLPASIRRAWETFSRKTGRPFAAFGDREPGETPAWTAQHEINWPGREIPRTPDESRGQGSEIPDRSKIIQTSPESFIQPNRLCNQALIRAVLEVAGSSKGKTLLDLYCGAGNFSIPLSDRGWRVLGVENNPFAIQDAKANATKLGQMEARFIQRETSQLKAEEILGVFDGEKPEIVLLDPPRRGTLEAIACILKLRPRQIIYVSCNPATFARDAREMNDMGYRAQHALVVPMFPNTAHVETVTSWHLNNTFPQSPERQHSRED
jgi:23S rRNA (uracil1939-C5)-methyltransferase